MSEFQQAEHHGDRIPSCLSGEPGGDGPRTLWSQSGTPHCQGVIHFRRARWSRWPESLGPPGCEGQFECIRGGDRHRPSWSPSRTGKKFETKSTDCEGTYPESGDPPAHRTRSFGVRLLGRDFCSGFGLNPFYTCTLIRAPGFSLRKWCSLLS